MTAIIPHLWFKKGAVEAATFYVSLFPDSRIDRKDTIPTDTPSGPPGTVEIVDFTLAGRPMKAIGAGPLDPFNHAISLFADCEDQAEVDRVWSALSDGGTVERCGWLRDRYGVSWQVVPKELGALMSGERSRAKRVMDALLGMKKIDIVALRKAAEAA